MREGRFKLGRAAFLAASMLFAAAPAIAQDGTGRSGSVDRPVVPARRKADREPMRSMPAPTPIRRIELGKLALSVNEGGSRVEISRLDQPGQADIIPIPARSSSLIIRTLAAGTYRISVSKAGYEGETQEVEITDGKRRRVSVYLKPLMAFITVGASVPDARIEIEKVGVYNRPIGKLPLKPGRYKINFTRRGYVTQNVSVDLKAAGREENLQIVMKPQRIDDVLDDASEYIAKGNYALAGELAGDVLVLNASHARANLVYGMAELRRGGPEATGYFLRAIRGGEVFRMPVKIQDAGNIQLIDAELTIGRKEAAIRSSERFELNFAIPRNNISDLRYVADPVAGFIVLTGKSDFHGRPISPSLRLYHHDIVPGPAANTTRCTSPNCLRETAELGKLLKAWRADLSFSR